MINKLIDRHSFVVMPKDINYANTLFGGKLLYELDMAGAQIVRRALYNSGSDGHVTAAMEKISFDFPAYKGDIILMDSEIKTFGRSSLTVRIKISRESLVGEIKPMCSASMVFVAMKEGKPFKHGLNFDKL